MRIFPKRANRRVTDLGDFVVTDCDVVAEAGGGPDVDGRTAAALDGVAGIDPRQRGGMDPFADVLADPALSRPVVETGQHRHGVHLEQAIGDVGINPLAQRAIDVHGIRYRMEFRPAPSRGFCVRHFRLHPV